MFDVLMLRVHVRMLHVTAVNAPWEEEPASEPEPELERYDHDIDLNFDLKILNL